ncbi:MAG TPA: flagellar biosynthesis protein FlhB [Micropepsaceae bacterium]|nr:flagellar biosynthesis protein FlhB [Micropepsaceae bacterium]
MAEENDKSQKTEEPTQKRLADAAEKGEAPQSQDVVTFMMMASATLIVAVMAAPAASTFMRDFRAFLERPHAFSASGAGMMETVSAIATSLLTLMALPLGAMLVAAVLGHVIQNPPRLSAERLKWSPSRLSPMEGAKRIFGSHALVNFSKGIIKMVAVGAAGVFTIWPDRARIAEAVTLSPEQIFPAISDLALNMLGAMLAVMAVFAALDWFFQRWSFMQRMRMSKQEIKEELRQSEGDPMVKAKLRQIRAEKSKKRMMAEVPKATVVIMNPTHFAVALRYEQGEMTAPVCVAKGVDALALRIRAVAEENGVPVVENPPLARALYSSVDIDDVIPPEQFKAVAQVIGYVYRLRRRN